MLSTLCGSFSSLADTRGRVVSFSKDFNFFFRSISTKEKKITINTSILISFYVSDNWAAVTVRLSDLVVEPDGVGEEAGSTMNEFALSDGSLYINLDELIKMREESAALRSGRS